VRARPKKLKHGGMCGKIVPRDPKLAIVAPIDPVKSLLRRSRFTVCNAIDGLETTTRIG
jgi:hypothetical protein